MGKFEEKWKKAFDDAEAEPSNLVWPTIDRELANAEGESMKRRVVLYQRIAAASILFAILVGSFGIYHWRENTSRQAQNNSLKNEVPAKDQKVTPDNSNTDPEVTEARKETLPLDKTSGKQSTASITARSGHTLNETVKSKEARNNLKRQGSSESNNNSFEKMVADSPSQSIAGDARASVFKTDIPHNHEKGLLEVQLKELPEPALAAIPDIHQGPVVAEIFRRLPAIPGIFMNKRRDRINHEKVWASVSAAAGSFGTGSSPNYAASSSAAAGNSYSLAMLGGVRVASRIVLQSGIQYTNQSAGSEVAGSPTVYAASAYTTKATAVKGHATTLSAYTVVTPSSNILNTNEFVSVPVQAGYLLIDKKFGLQLNSGVSTDFFVRNTVSDPSSQQQSYSQGTGQNSPYRTVNFSGLMNSEVSCRLGSRYRVSLVPGFRYSFNPILKSNEGAMGNQWMWDMGFRFRYIFR